MINRVLVLGQNGMLGSMVTNIFERSNSIELYTTSRSHVHSNFRFDAQKDNLGKLISTVKPNYIINCISINRLSAEKKFLSIADMFYVNSIFARKLSKISNSLGVKLIQPCTNAVYSGKKGSYEEGSCRIPTTIYGLSKMLGERKDKFQLNLRCSLIGPESDNAIRSLYSWVCRLPDNSEIVGYENEPWNGITTNYFAQICLNLVESGNFFAGELHLVPQNKVTKYELIKLILESINQKSVKVNIGKKNRDIDLTLESKFTVLQEKIWADVITGKQPTISEMVHSLQEYLDNDFGLK